MVWGLACALTGTGFAQAPSGALTDSTDVQAVDNLDPQLASDTSVEAFIARQLEESAKDPQMSKNPKTRKGKEKTILDAEETAAAQELSLEEAVSFALEHNKSLKASRLNMDLYKKKVMEAVSTGIPQINAGLSYQTNFGQEMELGGAMKIKMEDIMSVTASAQWMVLNGQWIVGIQSSKIAQNLAAQQTAVDELDVKSNIYNSYYIVLVTEHLVKIVEANLEDMTKIQKHTENLYAAGALEESDVDQIRITVGQLNNTLLAMKRTLDVNYNLLRIQLGLKAGTPLTLTDPLEAFLGEEGITKLFSIEFDVTDNLTYQTTLTQEQLQKKALSAARWACGPTLSAGYNYQYQIIEGGFMSIPHTAQVQLNVPIFSGLQRKSKIDQEKITLQQVQLNKSLLEDNLMLQEAQYKYNLQSASENYNLQKENVKVAKSVLGHYQAKYEAGAISSLDLTQANTNYLTAENNYMSACLELLQAQTELLKLYNELQ